MYKIEYEKNGVDEEPIILQNKKEVEEIIKRLTNDNNATNEVMKWCNTATNGSHFVNQKYRFEIGYKEEEKKNKTEKKNKVVYNVTNKEIVEKIKIAKRYINENNLTYNYNLRIYEDSVWSVDIELTPSGRLNFVVTKLEKDRSVRRYCKVESNKGVLSAYCDIKVKQLVMNKIYSLYKYLEKNGIV